MWRWAFSGALGLVLLSACGADTAGTGGSGGAQNPHHALAMHPEPIMVGVGGALTTTGEDGLIVLVRSDTAPNCPPAGQPMLPECAGDWSIGVAFAPSELVVGATKGLATSATFQFSGVPEGESMCMHFGPFHFSDGRVEVVAIGESSITVSFIGAANDQGLHIPLDGTYSASICN